MSRLCFLTVRFSRQSQMSRFRTTDHEFLAVLCRYIYKIRWAIIMFSSVLKVFVINFRIIFCEFRRLVQVSSLSDDSSTKRNSESIRALRAIRVLRPLKLVSGIPSKN